jgi:hypothetical protein
MDKENVVYTLKGIPLSLKKGNLAICNNMTNVGGFMLNEIKQT